MTGERDHGVVLEHRGGARDEAPLVGREAELDYLKGLYRRAVYERQAQVVLLVAGPGLGKTRLAHELIASLEERSERFSYFPARASELAAPSPYGVLAELIRVKTGSSRALSSEEAAAKLVDLVSWPFSSGTGLSTTSVTRRPKMAPWEIARTIGAAIGLPVDAKGEAAPIASPEKLAHSISSYLEALSRQQPVILVLDDLQRSDDESLDLLEQVSRQLEESPVMLLGLARPDFRETRPGFMAGFEHRTVLQLHTLTASAVTTQVSTQLGGAAPDGLGVAIHKRSGGNPNLVEEMVHALRDGGGLCRESEDGPWIFLGNVEDLDVPSRAEALLQARLDQLPRRDRELLRCAAVIGATFWEGALSAMGLERVEARLDELSQTDLINLRPTSRFPNTRQWSFKSALMAEVARGNLPGRDRRQIHQAFADWLGYQDQNDPETIQLRAHHLVRANQRSAALDLMADAGRLAERQQRWQVALSCFEQAHELARTAGDEASSLYYASHVGRLGVRAHAPSKSVPVLNRAIEEAEQVGDEGMQANLLQLLGRSLAILGEKQQAREVTERAHEIAERRGELRLRFETAKALGFVLYYNDEPKEAAEVFERCIAMAQELQDEAEVAINNYNVSDASLLADDWKRALEFADRAVEASANQEKLTFLRRSAAGLSAFVRAAYLDDNEAMEELEQWVLFADEHRYVDQQIDARYYLAVAFSRCGRREEALSILRAGLTLSSDAEDEQSKKRMNALLAELQQESNQSQ